MLRQALSSRSVLRSAYRCLEPVQALRSRFSRAHVSWESATTRAFHQTLHAPTARRKDILPAADTIYALSTAPGRAAIAVIRISGSACIDIYGGLCPNRPFPIPRTATLRRLHEPEEGDKKASILDSGALVLYFPGPQTVTGEDILELHVHGGPAIVRSVLRAIPKCTGSRTRRRSGEYSAIRPAEPGEFTKRAFYNGRLDLTQAEALGEALTAETEQQRRLAVMGAQSGLTGRYEGWRRMLLHARGELEALIDFAEDQHFDESPSEFMLSVTRQIKDLQKRIRVHIQNAARGELLRNGISIALLGAPNAGKSSLLNLIVGREAAIVSAEEGTTRDIVDVSIDIGGWLCKLGDMAGLRTGNAPHAPNGSQSIVGLVEREGMRRARARALQSDVVVLLLSVERRADGEVVLVFNEEVQDAALECLSCGKTVIAVVNKIDLLQQSSSTTLRPSDLHQTVLSAIPAVLPSHIFEISCRKAESSEGDDRDLGGLHALLAGLTSIFGQLTAAQAHGDIAGLAPDQANSYWAASLSITNRQSTNLAQCLTHLDDFVAQSTSQALPMYSNVHHIDGHDDLVGEVQHDIDIVAAAEHLRYAASCLSKITGKGEGGDVEDVLGVVFEK